MQIVRHERHDIETANKLLRLLNRCLEDNINDRFHRYPNRDFVIGLANGIYELCGVRRQVELHNLSIEPVSENDAGIREVTRKQMLLLLCYTALAYQDQELADYIAQTFFGVSLTAATQEQLQDAMNKFSDQNQDQGLFKMVIDFPDVFTHLAKKHQADNQMNNTPFWQQAQKINYQNEIKYQINPYPKKHQLITDVFHHGQGSLLDHAINLDIKHYKYLYADKGVKHFCRLVIPVLKLAFDENGVFYDCSRVINFQQLDCKEKILLDQLARVCQTSRFRAMHLVHWLRFNPDAVPAKVIPGATANNNVTHQLISYCERFIAPQLTDARTFAMHRLIDSNNLAAVPQIPCDIDHFEEVPRGVFDVIAARPAAIRMVADEQCPENKRMLQLFRVQDELARELGLKIKDKKETEHNRAGPMKF